MTENKRYYIGNGENCTICDSNQGGSDFYNMLTQFEAVDRLNEQDERIQELETVIQQILYETRANYTKEEYSATVSISPQMHDKLTELITEVK